MPRSNGSTLDIEQDVMTANEVAQEFGFARITVYKYWRRWKDADEPKAVGECLFPGILKGRDVLFRRYDIEQVKKLREKNK